MDHLAQSDCNQYGCVLIAGQELMTSDTASGYIADLKRFLSIRSDEELASALGIGKSTIASWRRRGSLSSGAMEEIDAKYGSDWRQKPSLDDFGGRLFEHFSRDVFLLSIMRLAKTIENEEVIEWASWLAGHEDKVRRGLCDLAGLDGTTVLDPTVVTNLVVRLVQGEIGTPDQLRQLRDALTTTQADPER